MKKLSLKPGAFKGEVLTRAQLKKVMGGYGSDETAVCKIAVCSFTDSNGNTSHGTCGGKGTVTSVPYGTITMECFCNTGAHTSPTPVESGGGRSKCYQ